MLSRSNYRVISWGKTPVNGKMKLTETLSLNLNVKPERSLSPTIPPAVAQTESVVANDKVSYLVKGIEWRVGAIIGHKLTETVSDQSWCGATILTVWKGVVYVARRFRKDETQEFHEDVLT
jgi:hypothetical protein